jgi:predicted CXXCH cytochrome family protein
MNTSIFAKKALAGLILFLLCVGVGPLAALAQDEVITISNEAFKPNDRQAAVPFSHLRHSEQMQLECKDCHHQKYEKGKPVEGDPAKCASCHKVKPTKENPTWLQQAFHKQCLGCHRKLDKVAKGKEPGPRTCIGCHKKK